MKKFLFSLKNSALSQNALLVQLLGLYPAIVLTKEAKDGFVIGFFVSLMLLFTGAFVSLLRPLISDHTRLCIMMLIIGTESTALALFTKALLPTLFAKYTVFFEMLCVTSIILARAEGYDRHAPLVKSVKDALGTGIGYSLVLILLGAVKEFLGAGTLLGGTPLAASLSPFPPMPFFLQPAGSLLILGFMVAAFNLLRKKQNAKKSKKEEL